MKPLILIVEDENSLAEVLSYNVEQNGFRANLAVTGEEALISVEEERPDLIILDWMLPYLSGLEVCRIIRRNSAFHNIPIIMLTARGEETDRIRGLEVGADDYLTKPFSPKELVLRIRTILRRSSPALVATILRYEGIEQNLTQYSVKRDGYEIQISPIEFKILRMFLAQPERVFSREQIISYAWDGHSDIEIRTIDVHIRRLRKALNKYNNHQLIKTVRSIGYKLQNDKI